MAWWEAADTCNGEPVPAPSGQRQSFITTGLDPEQIYYFAIRTADERLNWSEISNIYSTKYFVAADINEDGNINILDVMYLMNYFYKDGPPPAHMSRADINHDGMINILDSSYLINYLYRDGPGPA
ncbi:MAG: dockerin type I repeat-containing protein [Candidatus Zixiibacteriota bacterium]|nr:MAG: dockerin type I repeat-containing protein [candidate division Zixibacteria bacterium]